MKPVSLYMFKDGAGKLTWFPHQSVIFEAFVRKLKTGASICVEFKQEKSHKSPKQLSYWYGVLVPFAVDALIEAGHDVLFSVAVGELETGVATDKDTVDLLLKTLYKSHTSADELPRKRNMTSEQMSGLIDFALKWLAENLGVYCPTPKER